MFAHDSGISADVHTARTDPEISSSVGEPPTRDARWTEILPERSPFDLGLSELWRGRDLLWRFAQRGLTLRYRQTLLGVGWVVLQPLLASGVLALVFGQLAGLGGGGTPYLLTVYAALLPWNLVAQGIQRGGMTLVSDRNLVTKTFMPRMVLPLSSVVAVGVDLLVGLLFFFPLAFALGHTPGLQVLWLPLLCLPVFALAAGASLIVAALNVHYRDVRHTVPFLLQLAFFASPIAYLAARVPQPWAPLLALNPLAGQAEAFRWALLGGPFPASLFWPACAGSGLVLLLGLLFFRRLERTLADVI